MVADHRKEKLKNPSILKGCQNSLFSCTPAGCIDACTQSGGLRFAATSGYFLSTIRVVIWRLSGFKPFEAKALHDDSDSHAGR